MLVPSAFSSRPPAQGRAAALAELRLLLSRQTGSPQTLHTALSFGLAALDCHLPNGGLVSGALHEIVPATQAALPAAFGFIVAVLARFSSPSPEAAGNRQIIFVMPGYGSRQCGRLSGHGLNRLGFDPSRAIIVETAHSHDTLSILMEPLLPHALQIIIAILHRPSPKTSTNLDHT